jgi:tRNA (mo5U34)-methyltransferase
MNDEELAEKQRLINQVPWYHEFDFPNGLKGRSQCDVAFHRRIWTFIAKQLDGIDFRDKTVLDLGCWDGYWSFDAERRGARRVLATDDRTQNWAASAGILLAKDLLRSSIDTNLDISVYDLGILDEKFDIILCLGIYYHLVDPFYAFAQIRHRCHEETLVVFEGDTTLGLPPNLFRYNLANVALPYFTPTPQGLKQMLQACYFNVESQALMNNKEARSERHWLEVLAEIARGKRELPDRMDRLVTIARPFAGDNVLHFYRPPFGLHLYDGRFRSYECRSGEAL